MVAIRLALFRMLTDPAVHLQAIMLRVLMIANSSLSACSPGANVVLRLHARPAYMAADCDASTSNSAALGCLTQKILLSISMADSQNPATNAGKDVQDTPAAPVQVPLHTDQLVHALNEHVRSRCFVA